MSLNIHEKIGLGELVSSGKRAIISFWLIIFMAFFLFGDQNLIAPNMKNIGRSLGITDENQVDKYLGGYVSLLFFVLGGAVSISMGSLTQRFQRRWLLAGTVLLGESACIMTAFSRNYTEFLIWRTLCGFGLGGIFPVLFSILGDYFSAKSRAIATSYLSLAMGLGVGIGQLVGGILGQGDPENGWRTSFIIMSAPSFFFLALYAIFSDEPKRGGREESEGEELSHKISLEDWKVLFKSKTNLGMFLQGIPGCVPWGVFFVFLADYYEHTYSLSKTQAAGLITFAAIGIFFGTFSGGIIGQKLYNKNKKLQPVFCMAAILLGVPPCLWLLSAKEIAGTPFFIVLNIIVGFIITLPLANVRAILISANVPRRRSAMFSMFNLTDDLGKGLGPFLASIVLSLTPNRADALMISVLFWVPCGLAWIFVIDGIEADTNQVKLELEAERKIA